MLKEFFRWSIDDVRILGDRFRFLRELGFRLVGCEFFFGDEDFFVEEDAAVADLRDVVETGIDIPIGVGVNFLDLYLRLLASLALLSWSSLSSLVGIRSSTFSIVVSRRAGFRRTMMRVLSRPLCRLRLRRECRRMPAPEKASLSLRTMQMTAESAVEAVWFEDPS